MNKWLVAFTVMLPTLIEIIDISIVNVALDHIRGSLSAGIDEATWTLTSYLVSNAIIIPMTGWLSRMFGRKRYLLFSIVLFTVSSFFCGSAWSLESLVFFRVLQGLGGGALQPISQAVLLESFPPRQHGMAMAVFGIGIMVGPILGPVLGGWITDNWSWHWIFFINLPIGVLSIFMTMLIIKDPPYLRREKISIDYWGLALLALGLGSLQIVLDKGEQENWFSSPFIVWLTAIAAISLTLFIIIELRVQHPIVDLRALRRRTFALGNIVMFFGFLAFFSSIVLLPLYVQTLMGYTAFLAGLVLGPGGIASLIMMPLVAKLLQKVNPKGILIFGLATNAYATYVMSQFSLTADFSSVVWPRILLGIGIACFFIPLTTLSVSGFPKEEMGNASSLFNLVRNLGGSFGVAFVTTALAQRTQFHHERLAEHMTQFDRTYQLGVRRYSDALAAQGFPSPLIEQGTLVAIYQELIRQATMLAFNELFLLTSAIICATIPLVFFMKHSRSSQAHIDVH